MTTFPLQLLAFGFSSPWMLIGLVLAGIPIIVHLLHKRKYRETYWAAMRFLLEATRKHSRRLRLEQLVLLIVRTLILVFLVLALARPNVTTSGLQFRADVLTHRIIVVDASFSMAHQPAEFSRFDRAKDVARQIISGMARGDALNLVRICNSEPRTIIRQPAYQKNLVIDELNQLQVTHQCGDVLVALEDVTKLLSEVPDIPQKEVYLISDFQSESWAPGSSGHKAQIRRLLRQISQRANLVLTDLGLEGTQNSAILSFTVESPFVSIGRPVNLKIVVRNFGTASLPNQLLQLFVDNRLVETRRCDLPAGTEVTIPFMHRFDFGGEHELKVRLEEDSLLVDNVRRLSMSSKGELKVLLVNGEPAGESEKTATYHLRLALSPSTADKPWHGIMQPDVINEGDFATAELGRYDCIFLCNVAMLTNQEVQILQSYVNSGGGLIISLGDRVKVDQYNLRLYRNGTGLLPAKLGDRVGDQQAEPGTYFHFDPREFEHPIVRAFQGTPGSGLETVLTFQYFQATVPYESHSRVAMRFDSGDPAIVDLPVGQGRCILVTTSVDVKWSSWPLSPSYVPFMHELILYVVSGRSRERQVLVGEPLTRSFSSQAFDMPVTLKRPDGTKQPVRLTESQEVAHIVYESTDRSGFYEVTLGSPLNRTEVFAVNVDPRESDLRKLDENELKTEVLPGVEFTYRTEWRDVERRTDIPIVERGRLTRNLLFAVLCLVLVEQLMAWSFLYGFLSLYIAVAFVVVQWTVDWDMLYGSGLLLVFIVGFVLMIGFGRQSIRRSSRKIADRS